ncbi:MAG: signal peptidase II [Propionibacteriaceae bacterium]|jgi:signal peptidase II|nr:signal peptidase II [Propionibacteriaceae bacterium]
MSGRLSGRASVALISTLFVVGIALDQVTKAIALAKLTPGHPVDVVPQVLQLDLVRNPGAAFSTGTGFTVGFSILAACVLGAVIVWVVPKVRSRWWAIIVGLGLAGVGGNFIDRVFRAPGPFRGHVIDFFSLRHFAVFNVADILLTATAMLIIIDVVFLRIGLDGAPTDPKASEDTR